MYKIGKHSSKHDLRDYSELFNLQVETVYASLTCKPGCILIKQILYYRFGKFYVHVGENFRESPVLDSCNSYRMLVHGTGHHCLLVKADISNMEKFIICFVTGIIEDWKPISAHM